MIGAVAAENDIFCDGVGVAAKVLKYGACLCAPFSDVELTEVNAIYRNPAVVGVIVTEQQFDKRRFTGAILSDYGNSLTRIELEVDVLECRPSIGIGERDIFETDSQRSGREWYRVCWIAYSGLDVHEVEVFLEEQQSLEEQSSAVNE